MNKYELVFVGVNTVHLTDYTIEIATGYTIKTKNSENALICFNDERFTHLYNNLILIYYVDQDFLSFDDLTKHQMARIIKYKVGKEDVSKEDFIKSLKKDCETAGEKYCVEFFFYETQTLLCNEGVPSAQLNN